MNDMKDIFKLLVLCAMTVWTMTGCGGSDARIKQQQAQADSLLNVAYRANEYKRLETLADSLQEAVSQNGVSLNFRHAESKITVKVYNGNNMVRVYATTWEIGYLSPSATFTYQDATTDGNNSGMQLNYANWSNWTPATAATEYFGGTTNISFENFVPAANAQAIPGEMILVPQQLVPATGYDSNNPNGAYIGVKVRIANIDDNTVIYGGNDGAWAIWPVDTKWLPGKKYTYIIDLGDGGYKKIVPDGPLDPVLKEVKTINVTVDDWVD